MKWEPPDVGGASRTRGKWKLILVLGIVVAAGSVLASRWSELFPSEGSEASPEPEGVSSPSAPSQPSRTPAFPPPLHEHPLVADLVASLSNKEYDALEGRLAELHGRGRLEGSFETHLHHVLRRLVKVPTAVANLDAWAEARKESFWASLVQGRWLIEARRLKDAKTELRRAAKLDPKNPYPPTLLLRVAVDLKLPEAERERYQTWARKADPRFVQAYFNRLEGLKPRRGGSLSAALAYCLRAVQQTPQEPALQILKIDLLQGLATAPRGARPLSPAEQKALDADYLALTKAYPKSRWVSYQRAQFYRITKRSAERGKWLRRAADTGSAVGMRYLGLAYFYGRYGLKQDYSRSYRWARRAAEEGWSAQACGDVGLALYKGRGAKENLPAAYAWFQRGAGWGNAFSMSWLGRMHTEGRGGIARDPRKAIPWFRRAARAGDRQARKLMEKLLAAHPELKDAE